MKNNLLKFLSLIVFTFISFVFTFGQVKEKPAEKTLETAGLLYRITGKDLKKPSYLFGTVHIVCAPDMLPMKKLNEYLDRTDRLVLELDMDNQGEMASLQKSLLMPGGKSLADYLKPEQLAKVDELTKKMLGLPIEQVKNLRPLMLQVMLISSPKVMGCNPPASYDLAFLQSAVQKKKPVEGLETIASQIEALDSQPMERQAELLFEMALRPEKAFADFKKLLETYKTQNSDALYDLINIQMPEKDRAFQTRLLDARNMDWIPKIEKFIKENSAFIAVGGGHLGGKNGVVNLLKAKGYRVQAIKL